MRAKWDNLWNLARDNCNLSNFRSKELKDALWDLILGLSMGKIKKVSFVNPGLIGQSFHRHVNYPNSGSGRLNPGLTYMSSHGGWFVRMKSWSCNFFFAAVVPLPTGSPLGFLLVISRRQWFIFSITVNYWAGFGLPNRTLLWIATQ